MFDKHPCPLCGTPVTSHVKGAGCSFLMVSSADWERLKSTEAAMREWFDANKAEDMERWLRACRAMDTLMGGNWVETEPPLTEIDFSA